MIRLVCKSPAAAFACLLAGLALLASACGGSPPAYVYHYVLNYPPPAPVEQAQRLDAALKVERLGSLPLVNTQKMLVMLGGHEVSQISDHRWQSYPADMVSSLLSRDLQAGRRYKAVFGPDSSQLPRFRLEGGVVQFVEKQGKGGNRAVLRLELTLLDDHQQDVLKQVMYQKSYAHAAPLAGGGGAALAQAMSQAMAALSPQARSDLATAISARLAEPDPKQDKGGK